MFFVVFAITNNVIVGPILPYIYAVFFVAKSLECRHKSCKNCILQCRDRRPRRSVFKSLYPQQNVNMVRHNHVTLN
ncbi:MAG: hypothetical protein IJF10_05220 [Clostridia bacterium]|nr:hypothetical protein [Clostridia bacterium]